MPSSPPDVQLDLFGEVEGAEAARAAWLARFERPDWIAPHDTAAGLRPGDPPLKKGERSPVPGWRCPDPECGRVELTSYRLRIGHGFNPDVPGQEPFDGRCVAVRLRRNQAEAAARRDAAAAEAIDGLEPPR